MGFGIFQEIFELLHMLLAGPHAPLLPVYDRLLHDPKMDCFEIFVVVGSKSRRLRSLEGR